MVTFESPSGRRYKSPGQFAEGTSGAIHKCTVQEKRATLPGCVAVKVVSWHPKGLNKQTVLAERVALERIVPHDGIIRLLDSWVAEKVEKGEGGEEVSVEGTLCTSLYPSHYRVLRLTQ